LRYQTSHVITGLVPVIPKRKSAALHEIGMAGTDPRIKSGDGHDGRSMKLYEPAFQDEREG